MAGEPGPVVFLTDTVSVRGKVTRLEDSDKPVYTYLGIPFAEPPSGKLRLQRPVTRTLWDGERDATKHGPAPNQSLVISIPMLNGIGMKAPETFGEDCLHLSIYSPTTSPDADLPVMVWFYGGGFTLGFTDPYIGTAFPALQDVLLVTVTYRIGPLGFFSTGDDLCPGNFGLWDQIEGLKWIQKYIHKFGGDPNNVTLFGESAGGISASLHHVISQSRGLFHKAIHMSGVGSLQGPQLTPQKCTELCKQIAKGLDLPAGSSPADVYKAMRDLPIDELVTKIGMIRTVPNIDGHLLTQDSLQSYTQADFYKSNSIFTMNSHEGAMIYNLLGQTMPPPKTRSDFLNTVKGLLGYQKNYKIVDIEGFAGALVTEYVPGEEAVSEDTFTMCGIEILTDIQFYSQITKFVKLHAASVPDGVYFGVYDYRFSRSTQRPGVTADHGEDLPILFGVPLLPPADRPGQDWSETDKAMSQTIIEYFTNFAKTGNPNGGRLTSWPCFTQDKPGYLLLDETCKAHEGPYKPSRGEFWSTQPQKYM